MKDKSFNIIPFIFLIIIMIALLGTLSISQSLSMFTAVWLLPTIVIILIDNSPRKYLLTTVAIFNFAGITPVLIHILQNFQNMNIIIEQIVQSKETWLFVYLYSACGWLSYHLIPVITSNLYKNRLKIKITLINEKVENLKRKWEIDKSDELKL